MTELNLLPLLLTALAYYYFHRQYFAFIGSTEQIPSMKKGALIGSFFLNYAVFTVCSFLELHLVVNWLLFFLCILFETQLYDRRNSKNAVFFSALGIFYGLSINILCRCIIAIALDKPLFNFGNSDLGGANMKTVPIILGFLLAGLVMHWMRRKAKLPVRLILKYPGQCAFLTRLLAGLLIYLYLNLLLYQSDSNGILLKLWGIKSFCFSAVGLYLGVRYAHRMCRLAEYRNETKRVKDALTRKKQEEREFNRLAYHDPLTGCYTRPYAFHTIADLLERQEPFSLCFVDLDLLKYVNDTYGHAEGDRYLTECAREMQKESRSGKDLVIRYGGDEFILLFLGLDEAQAGRRIEEINGRLAAASNTDEFPFPMSLSYGVVSASAADSADRLIQLADARMYAYKKQKSARGPEKG